MSATTLEAGQNINLTGSNPLLDDIVVGFGWRVIESNTADPEVVPMALLVGTDGHVVNDDAVAFFNQLTTPDGAVQYVTGDDQEQVDITLSAVPADVKSIVFLLFINPDLRSPGTFRAVRNAHVTISDRAMNAIARAPITTGNSDVNVVVCGELYRYNGNWKFRALGDGYLEGITAVAREYGFTL